MQLLFNRAILMPCSWRRQQWNIYGEQFWGAVDFLRSKAILITVIKSRLVSHSICGQDVIINTIRRDCSAW